MSCIEYLNKRNLTDETIKYFKLGLLSSVFSMSLLFILIYQINNRFKELELLKDSNDIIIVLIFTLIFGVLTSVISSYLVTQKYLNLKTSEYIFNHYHLDDKFIYNEITKEITT